ncbi:MAG: glycosyltransferase family 2 protein [Bacteroidetes bacterium]|nr:glycosyltransferase family 2 protein [Fibrella sp.]
MAERECVRAGRPLVSIITINYNQAATTRQFLDSCAELTYPNYEIIVVDNASEPALADSIDLQSYARVRLVRSATNLGFAGGNNLGMQEATGDFFFIVNNDTELNATLLDDLLLPFSQNEQIGVTCPKIRYYDSPTVIQYAGYSPMNMFTGTAVPIGYRQTDNGAFNQPGTTHFAHGCAMMVRRAVVERVGRFAERFFLYYEELDWSQRIRDAGYLIQYQPTGSILHKESVSVGQFNPLKTYYMTRNRILFMRRHCSVVQQVVFCAFFVLCVAPKHLLGYVLTGRLDHANAFTKGMAWNLTTSSASPV